MKNRTLRKMFLYAAVVVVSFLLILAGNRIVLKDTSPSEEQLVTARVLSIDAIDFVTVESGAEPVINETVLFTARITSGPLGGSAVEATQYIDNLYPSSLPSVVVGSRVILQYADIGGESVWLFSQFNRIGALAVLLVIFFLMIACIARKKSPPILLSLIISCFAVVSFYLPAIRYGYPIYPVTVLTAVFIIAVSLLLIGGFGKKSAAAIIGNAGGVLLSGLLASLFIRFLDITGLVSNDQVYLLFLFEDHPLDLRAIVWSGVVIGSLGAVMDVAMAITSAINELAENARDRSFKNLWKSGMNIGRDAIGTMTNTLILAYIGSSLATVLLLYAYNGNLLYLLNLEMIVVEIMQAVVGSAGILFAVPVSAAVSAAYFRQKNPDENPGEPPAEPAADAEPAGKRSPKEDKETPFRIGHDPD